MVGMWYGGGEGKVREVGGALWGSPDGPSRPRADLCHVRVHLKSSPVQLQYEVTFQLFIVTDVAAPPSIFTRGQNSFVPAKNIEFVIHTSRY